MMAVGGAEVGGIAGRIVPAALSWLGTPYRHQGTRRGVGCDCLGLVLGVWRDVYGQPLPKPAPYTMDWAESGGEDLLLQAARRHCIEKPRDLADSGDLILFRWRPHLPAKHAAILIDRERFVHACEGKAVVISYLVPQWRKRIAGAFAFPETPSLD